MFIDGDLKKALAKRWGMANGFEGREGGWIYRDGRPFMQGWAQMFDHNRKAIARWYAENPAKIPRPRTGQRLTVEEVNGVWIFARVVR